MSLRSGNGLSTHEFMEAPVLALALPAAIRRQLAAAAQFQRLDGLPHIAPRALPLRLVLVQVRCNVLRLRSPVIQHPGLVFFADVFGHSLRRTQFWLQFCDGAVDEGDVLAAEGRDEVVWGEMDYRRVFGADRSICGREEFGVPDGAPECRERRPNPLGPRAVLTLQVYE